MDLTNHDLALLRSHYATSSWGGLRQAVAVLDADTRRQFDQVYEAILGLMATPLREQQARPGLPPLAV